MPTRGHEDAIAEILKAFPGSARRGFMRSVRRAIPGAEWFAPIGAIPDAYQIDHEARCVVIFEVEATHRVPDEKMAEYAGLWWGVDGLDWDLVLMKISARGVEEIDLGDYAIRLAISEADPTQFDPHSSWGAGWLDVARGIRISSAAKLE